MKIKITKNQKNIQQKFNILVNATFLQNEISIIMNIAKRAIPKNPPYIPNYTFLEVENTQFKGL